MPTRPRFDPSRPLVAARAFTFAGRAYSVGDPFPNPEDGPFADRLRARQYEARAVNMTEATPQDEDPVQMTGPKGGRYEITAPWLERPLTIRGKVNADKALAEMREEGPPLGFIDGGSDVEVEEIGGGWYQIDAPWLEEPAKEQGREAAEAKQREIHEAGEPDYHHGVTLTEGENAYWTVKTDWSHEPETVHGEEAARARAAELRDAGPPPAEDDEASEGDEGDQTPPEGAEAAEAGQDGDNDADAIAAKSSAEQGGEEASGGLTGVNGPVADEGADSGAEATEATQADDQATQTDAPADDQTETAPASEETTADAATEPAAGEEPAPAPRKRSRAAKAAKAEAGPSKGDDPADA